MAPRPPVSHSAADSDRFERPARGWYVLIHSAVAITGVLAASQRAYDAARGRVPLPSRRTIQAIAVGTVVVHVLEAGLAYRMAQRFGHRRSARRWAVEAFVVGFPAILKLRSVGLAAVTDPDAEVVDSGVAS